MPLDRGEVGGISYASDAATYRAICGRSYHILKIGIRSAAVEGAVTNMQKWANGAAAVPKQAQSSPGSETDTSRYLSGNMSLEEYAQRLEESTPPASALQRSLQENRDFVQRVATWLQQADREAPSEPENVSDSPGK